MGWLSTLGHMALQYGPYVAAPFTGGASLALAPAASAANAAWGATEANAAKNKFKPIGPSPGVGTNTGTNAGSGSSGNIFNTSGTSGSGGNMVPQNQNVPGQGKVYEMNTYGPTGITKKGAEVDPNSLSLFGMPSYNDYMSQQSQSPTGSGSGSGGLGPSSQMYNQRLGMMPQDSSNPNLSFALNQGKLTALKNQPWRRDAGIYPSLPNRRPSQSA